MRGRRAVLTIRHQEQRQEDDEQVPEELADGGFETYTQRFLVFSGPREPFLHPKYSNVSTIHCTWNILNTTSGHPPAVQS